MSEYSVDENKKIARSLVRLQHSIEADREIKAMLEQMERLGTEGSTPQIEMKLADLLGQS